MSSLSSSKGPQSSRRKLDRAGQVSHWMPLQMARSFLETELHAGALQEKAGNTLMRAG